MSERHPLPVRASLIGAPTDIGASVRGASMGPEALRVANIEGALRARGVEVRDAGNLGGPRNRSCRRSTAIATWTRSWPGTAPSTPLYMPS